MIKVKKDISKKILSNIKAMVTKSVFVGIPDDKNNREGSITNSQIAFINEFEATIKIFAPVLFFVHLLRNQKKT